MVPQYYRRLPFVGPADPQRETWRVRRASFSALLRVIGPRRRVLDLGAGNGWLAYQLLRRGHSVTPVDLSDDEFDGLGALGNYPMAFDAYQADFAALPFAAAQFDLVIFNASLHYASDLARTIAEGLRMLAPGGRLVVMDSPLYHAAASGRTMLAEKQRELNARFGVELTTGAMGFLTFADFNRLSHAFMLKWRWIEPFVNAQWATRHWRARLAGRREPAQFGLMLGNVAIEHPPSQNRVQWLRKGIRGYRKNLSRTLRIKVRMLYTMMRISILLMLLWLLIACNALVGPLESGPLPGAPTPLPVVSTATATPEPVAATPTPVAPAPDSAPAAVPVLGGVIVASVYRNWDWDIYALSPSGTLLRRLTFGDGDSRAPAWSPDGLRVAFESNRNHNWDIYSMAADGSDLRRLTADPHFDGSPRWSPDGRRIAFTSDRTSDLDIWLMSAADGSELTNLTANSPTADYDPAWSPDGKQLAYTSLREGTKTIFLSNADGSNIRRLTPPGLGECEQPAWSPDGARLAFTAEQRASSPLHQRVGGGEPPTAEQRGAREIYLANTAGPLNPVRVTALEYHQWPAWLPDGSGLIFVAQSEKAQALQSVQSGHPALRLTSGAQLYRQPDWSARAAVEPDLAGLQQIGEPLYVERTTPNPPDHPDRYNMVRLNGVRVVVPALSDAVDDSFYAARQRIAQETGWDYLAQLAEAMRPLAFKSDTSDFLSWHKAGRAIDVSFTFPTRQGNALEIAREDVLGDTYWRLYLKTASQDGSQGEPLRQPLYDLSAEARNRSKGQGGLSKGILPGYYVDVTELLRQYGWWRIGSHTEPDFDWRRDYAAIEFWHYQKTDGLTWWPAIQEIFPPKTLGDMFSYQSLVRAHYDVSVLIQKGVPVPPDVMLKYSTLQP